MANNPNHRKNLKPFKKGVDERRNITGLNKLPDLKILLADSLGNNVKGKTDAQAIIDALRAKAKKGDVRAAEILFDRAWGKAKQEIDLFNKGVTTIRIVRDKEL